MLTGVKIQLDSVSQIHGKADLKMFERTKGSDDSAKYFNIRPNNLRSSQIISPVEVARTERVNNMFSWRTARMFRK